MPMAAVDRTSGIVEASSNVILEGIYFRHSSISLVKNSYGVSPVNVTAHLACYGRIGDRIFCQGMHFCSESISCEHASGLRSSDL